MEVYYPPFGDCLVQSTLNRFFAFLLNFIMGILLILKDCPLSQRCGNS